MNLSKEEKLIFEMCKAEISEKGMHHAMELSVDNIKWEIILKKIDLNGVSHIIYHNLIKEKGLLSKVPDDVIEKLKEGYYCNLRQNILFLNELADIIALLKSKGVDIIILKGAALAESVYDNLALRGMSDIDILIQSDDFRIIDEQLKICGYALLDDCANKSHPSVIPYLNTFLYRKDGGAFFLHLHWHFINSTIPTHSYIYKINMYKIWDEAVTERIGGIKTFVLAPHHLLMHLSEHGLRIRHSFNKLILLIDIAKALSQYQTTLNWDRLVEDSMSFNLSRMVWHSLYLCKEYFNIDIPYSVLARVRPEHFNTGEKIFLSMALKNRRKPGLSYPVHFAMNKGFMQKGKFIFRTLFPPKAIMDQRSCRNRRFHPFARVKEIIRQTFC